MSVSIHEMERTISNFPDIGLNSDAGNTIDVSDVTDDLGMNFLANTKFMGGANVSVSKPQNNVVSVQSIAPALQEVEFAKLEPLQPISIDTAPSQMPEISIQKENYSGSGVQFETLGSSSGPSINLSTAPNQQQPLPTSLSPPMDAEEERKKKSELINKLQRLEQKGYPVARRFTMDNTLDEVKAEYNRLVDAKQLETSIKFQRNMLMGFTTGLEWLNNKFDPFDVKLDGWSESVHESVEDYDDIFEELYDKYKDRGQMPPEARLVFQLASSGFMCHISNSFFRSKMPTAESIFKSNPELAKQFTAAAAAQASPAFGNFMGMAMGNPPVSSEPAGFGQGQNASFAQNQRERAGVSVPETPNMGPAGAFFQGARSPQNLAAQNPPQVARREMKGPTGVDDILKTFEQVREAEASMSINPPMQGNNGPSVQAAQEIQSLHSEEMSMAGSDRTGGGRRRKRAAPTGNIISLGV
jgi:hypothetical protein